MNIQAGAGDVPPLLANTSPGGRSLVCKVVSQNEKCAHNASLK